MSQQPEQTEYYMDDYGFKHVITPIHRLYASQQTASLQKEIARLKDFCEEYAEDIKGMHKERMLRKQEYESLQKQLEKVDKEANHRMEEALRKSKWVADLKKQLEEQKQVVIDLLNDEDVREYIHRIKQLEEVLGELSEAVNEILPSWDTNIKLWDEHRYIDLKDALTRCKALQSPPGESEKPKTHEP